MKSIVKHKCSEPKPNYPCLKISRNGMIVLFKEAGHGTVINSGNTKIDHIGYCAEWFESDFVHFTGTVELSN